MDIQVSLPGDGVEGLTSDGRPLLVRAPLEATNGRLRLIEIAEERRDVAMVHRHPYDEAWYVLEGEYHLYAGGEWWDAPAGTFIFVPGGIEHGFAVSQPARKLSVALPDGEPDLTTAEQLGPKVRAGDENP